MKRDMKFGPVNGFQDVSADDLRRLGSLFSLPEKGRISVLNPEFGDGAEVSWFLEGMAGKEAWDRVEVFGIDENPVHVQDFGANLDYAITGSVFKGTRISNACFGICFCIPQARDIGRKSRTETVCLEPIARRLKGDGALCYILREEIALRGDFQKAFSRRFSLKAVYRLSGKDWKRRVVLVGNRKTRTSVEAPGEYFNRVRDAETIPVNVPAQSKLVVPCSDPDAVSEFSGEFDAGTAAKALSQAGFSETLRMVLFPERKNDVELQRSPQPPDEGKLIMLGITNQAPGRIGEEGKNLILKRGSGGRQTTSVFDERNGMTVIVDTTRNEAAVNILLPGGEARTLQ